jgi:hypothetical protein
MFHVPFAIMSQTIRFVAIQRRTATMKKLMTLMLGAALAIGAVSMYAQDKKEDTKKDTKKANNKKKDTTKKKDDKK